MKEKDTVKYKEECIYSLFSEELKSERHEAIGRVARVLLSNAKPYNPADYSKEDMELLLPVKRIPEAEKLLTGTYISMLDITGADGTISKEDAEELFLNASDNALNDVLQTIDSMGTVTKTIWENGREVEREVCNLISHICYNEERGIYCVVFNEHMQEHFAQLSAAIKEGGHLVVKFQHAAELPEDIAARKIIMCSLQLMDATNFSSVKTWLGEIPGVHEPDLIRAIKPMAKIIIKQPGIPPIKTSLLSDVEYEEETSSLEIWDHCSEYTVFPVILKEWQRKQFMYADIATSEEQIKAGKTENARHALAETKKKRGLK